METKTKFCKWCGETIDFDCIVCPKCGKQVEELKTAERDIIINNSASAVAESGKSSAKMPWYATWFWIIVLSFFTGGLYLIPGIIIRSIWKSKH